MLQKSLSKELLTNVKQSAIDCSIHSRSTSKEKLQCFSIGNPDEKPSIIIFNGFSLKKNKATIIRKVNSYVCYFCPRCSLPTSLTCIKRHTLCQKCYNNSSKFG